jgi:selenocysteine-specific elongation factor
MRVIGTAGHVDHGKSTLVRRLTGIDPDRLQEEKKRQMTIDLGFAWLTMPDGETVGIIDVPGHRDFIENMLAGVGGIDAVLLVVAADEGVMPQTREHLAIVDLLGVESGIIALTKIDLVDDPDWLELVEQEVREVTAHTSMENAPVVRLSAQTGTDIQQLIDYLSVLFQHIPPRSDSHQPRLSIDRVFTMSGFGTVVTGTLLGGSLHIGDEIEIQPASLHGRIRGLQTYQKTVETAYPGSRVAINISGIEKAAVSRGCVLSYPGQLQPSILVDAYFRHLKAASRPLKHNAEVKLFVGASESNAHVRLLTHDMLPPGTEGWLQIRLEKSLPISSGDRFILRYPSPSETIGGGMVVNAHPGRRWRRFQPQIIEQLETRLSGTPAERVAQAANQIEPCQRSALQQHTGYSDHDLNLAITQAVTQGLLVQLPGQRYIAAARWHLLRQQMHEQLADYHTSNPLRPGIPREQLRSQLGLKQAGFNDLLAAAPVISEGNLIRLADHRIRFDSAQQAQINQLMRQMDAAPYTPPSYQQAVRIVGADVLQALIDLGEIVQVQPDVIFTRAACDEMISTVLALIDTGGEITTAQFRDHFQTTRKYAIGLLEYLDAIGITRRVGDVRVRGARA